MKVVIDSQKLNQPGENIKVDLQQVLDNTCDKYSVTPVEISYYVGYYNLIRAQIIYTDTQLELLLLITRYRRDYTLSHHISTQ
jgi:hypothetical protein